MYTIFYLLSYAGTSMGLNSISFTNDTNIRTPDGASIAASLPPFDTKLLGQLKHLLPGIGNIHEFSMPNLYFSIFFPRHIVLVTLF